MNQNKGRIALLITFVLVFAILVPVASGIENEISEENQAAEPSLPDLLSGQRGDRNRTNNFTDETGFLNGTYPWSDLPPDYRFDNQLEENIPYDLLASTGSWTLLNANPGWSARSEHSAVVMPVDGSIVLMGGAGQGLFNDVGDQRTMALPGHKWFRTPPGRTGLTSPLSQCRTTASC